MEQAHAEQLTKYRQEYDAHIQKLQSRVQELEQLNANLQGFTSNFFHLKTLHLRLFFQQMNYENLWKFKKKW